MNTATISSVRLFAMALIALGISGIVSCSGNKENPLIENGGDKIPPATPLNLAFLSVGNGEIFLQWDENTEPDLAGYRLYRSDNGNVQSNYRVVYDSTATRYRDSDLDYDTQYYYRIAAYDISDNESPPSEPMSGIPQNTQAPNRPQNLLVYAYNIDQTYFSLLWDANAESDLRGYRIYRGMHFNDVSTLVDSTANTFFEDYDVLVDTVCFYKITAYDKGGWESPATQPESDIALSPPTLLAPIDTALVSATPVFSWSPVTNAEQYRIFVQTSSQAGEIWTRTLGKTETSVQYDGAALQSGRTYYWKVATITKDTEGLNSISVIQVFRVR